MKFGSILSQQIVQDFLQSCEHFSSLLGQRSYIQCRASPLVPWVLRATPGEEVVDANPAVTARSLLVGSVSVWCDLLRQMSWSPSSVSCVAARKIIRRQSWDPSRCSLVVDADVRKSSKQACYSTSVPGIILCETPAPAQDTPELLVWFVWFLNALVNY